MNTFVLQVFYREDARCIRSSENVTKALDDVNMLSLW